jgi:hypothetical protein
MVTNTVPQDQSAFLLLLQSHLETSLHNNLFKLSRLSPSFHTHLKWLIQAFNHSRSKIPLSDQVMDRSFNKRMSSSQG